jgi:hypothetical protein
MRNSKLWQHGLAAAVLAALALANPLDDAKATGIRITPEDPSSGGDVGQVTLIGDGPEVIYDRDYGTGGGRREIGVDDGQPDGTIRIPVRDGMGLLDWLWKLRRLLDVTPV